LPTRTLDCTPNGTEYQWTRDLMFAKHAARDSDHGTDGGISGQIRDASVSRDLR
jgi:hypothetical protein